MYQISGEGCILEWMSTASPTDQAAMLDWLPALANDPAGVAAAMPSRPGVPAYVARVPGTHTFVDYAVVEQYKTVLLTGVMTSPLADEGEAGRP